MKSKEIIKNYIIDNPKEIVKIVFLMFSSLILLLGFPLILKFIIQMFTEILHNNALMENLKNQELINENHQSTIISIFLVIGLGLDVILSCVVNIFLSNSCSKLGSEITELLRKNAYSSLLRGEYYEIQAMNTDEAVNILLDSTDIIGNKYIANHLIKIIYLSLSFVASLVLLFCFNAIAGFIVLGTAPIIYLANLYIGKFIKKQNSKYNGLVEQRNLEIQENIRNLKEIKIRNGIEKEEHDYNEISNKIKKNSDMRFTLNAFSKSYMNVLISDIVIVVLVSTFIYSISELNNLNLSLAIATILTSPIVYTQLHNLLNCYFEKLYVKDAYTKVDNILDLRAEARNESLNSLSDEVHSLVFNNVSFEYNLSQTGVDKLSFELKKGETLGILGYQKSGKTTILDLITKVIRPRFGNVLINNCDVNKLSTAYLRDIVTYVPQEFKLFDGTIEENITYPNVIDEYKYNDALNKCKLKVLLMNLPKRDQELVKNVKLSLADIEKIGLANAFYKDSPIILLDEATNKLDQITEKDILDEFYKLKNKIMIIASNRISTLAKCNKILILNEGKVVEYGNTSDLMANSRSAYSKMMNDINR